MSSSINSNLPFLNALTHLNRTQGELAVSIARLSSGLRINSARDDAAGLATAERLNAQVRGLTQASRNVNEGISLGQIADGSLTSIVDSLQRMRELAVQSANASNSPADRAALQLEVAQLQQEIGSVASQTAFNGIKLLDGSFSSKVFQVGANVGETVAMAPIASARPEGLGVYRGFSLRDQSFGLTGNGTHALSVSIGGGAPISLGTAANDAASVTAAINAGNIPGLTASAGPTIVLPGTSSASATADGVAVYTINGVAINIAGVDGGAGLATNRSAAVAAINAVSATTQVVASDTGSGVTMTAADGRNVLVSYSAGSFTNSTANDFGLPSIWITGSGGHFDYVAPAGVSGTVSFTFGWATTAFAIGTTGTAVSAMNVSTVEGANAAIRSLDVALEPVNASRASVGATQNRFAAILDNLQVRSADLAAARSRIMDADFARETASLARNQILQDAGIAMLAQANQLPNRVMTLLSQL